MSEQGGFRGESVGVSGRASLWCWKILKKIGDACGGFMAVDEDTMMLSELSWARILMRMLLRWW